MKRDDVDKMKITGKELVSRYIYVVEKNIGTKNGKGIHQDIIALIEDTADATYNKATDDLSYEEAKSVLGQLGSPLELASKYDDESNQTLLSQPWLGIYKIILKIVIFAVTLGISIASILYIADNNLGAGEAIRYWISELFNALTGAFTFPTLIFIVLQRKNIRIKGFYDDLDDLPPVPEVEKQINKTDTYVNMGITVLFTILFFTCNGLIRLIVTDQNINIPIFDGEKISSIWYLFVFSCGISLVSDIVKLVEGSHRFQVSLISIICSVFSLIISYFIIIKSHIFNPEYFTAIETIFSNEE